MNTTDYSIESLKWIISSEQSLDVLMGIINDMDLEIEEIKAA